VVITGCGGGGGSGASPVAVAPAPPAAQPAPTSAAPGEVLISVVDVLNAPVPYADVSLYSNSPFRQATADANGQLTFQNVSPGFVEAFGGSADASQYSLGYSGRADLAANGHVSLRIETRPVSNPIFGLAGGFVDDGGVSADGRSLTFRVLLLYVGGNRRIDYDAGGPVDVRVADCAPNATNDAPDFHADCIEGAPGFDAAFSVNGGHQYVTVPNEYAATPQSYTASLLLDQSERIAASDPYDLRLLGIKNYFSLKGDSSVSLAGFAADNRAEGKIALIPNQPVTLFSSNNTAPSVEVIDDLATLEGGASPLYTAIDRELDRLLAIPIPAQTNRMLAVLTDGTDDTCGTAAQCRAAREALARKSLATRTEIVTIATGAEQSRREISELTAASRSRTFWVNEPEKMRVMLTALPDVLSKFGQGVEVRFRIDAASAGVFRSGRMVFATLSWEECPFECSSGSIPVAIPIP
jgi:hypothetical protein